MTSLRYVRGNFANDGEKPKILKSIEQGHTEGTFFHYRSKFLLFSLYWASPKPQKAKAKAKMALASLVSFQKQKHTIVKVFMKSDAKKAVFQRGE